MGFFLRGDQRYGKEHTQQQSHNGIADEGDEGVQEAGAEGAAGEGGHRGQGDQHDGQQNGGEAVQSAGQLAVLFLQLIQRILGVGGDVDLAGYQLGIQDGNHNGGNGDHQTDKNGQAQIRVQRTGHGDGAGGGRNQTVGGVQTAGKRGAHNGQRDVGLCSQSTADGGQDHEAGITEYGNTGHIAHGAHGDHAPFLADQFQDGVCHGQRGTGLLQNGADDGTAENHDADARHNVAEAALDAVYDLGGGQLRLRIHGAPDQTDQKRNDRHNDERMDLPF